MAFKHEGFWQCMDTLRTVSISIIYGQRRGAMEKW